MKEGDDGIDTACDAIIRAGGTAEGGYLWLPEGATEEAASAAKFLIEEWDWDGVAPATTGPGAPTQGFDPNRYIVTRADGTRDPRAKYFVLRYDEHGSDPKHVAACRVGFFAYAIALNNVGHLPELAHDIVKIVGELVRDPVGVPEFIIQMGGGYGAGGSPGGTGLSGGIEKPHPPEKLALDCHIPLTEWEEARALHRLVRAMHDGHCPNCRKLTGANAMLKREPLDPRAQGFAERRHGHQCPGCGFAITQEEEDAILEQFAPVYAENLKVLARWRERRAMARVAAAAE